MWPRSERTAFYFDNVVQMVRRVREYYVRCHFGCVVQLPTSGLPHSLHYCTSESRT
jgi:hypothetical protein